MEIRPIADFHSPFGTKFGIPRQSGIIPELEGKIVFRPEYRNAEALRGLEEFDYLWLIWEFSANRGDSGTWSPTVRPPRLGGNARIGVFASRSPFRPNGLGLSAARILRIEKDGPEGPVIHVSGADLMDGTPIYDIKPYVTYADSRPDARSGFVDANSWSTLEVIIPAGIAAKLPEKARKMISGVLAQDPRPQYHDDPEKIYGMEFDGMDVRFRVHDGIAEVTEIIKK
ncbi:tRNA-Thr(GGU) m(6)t(6)A37 methyltransferase TsaA [Bacteroidales bacterium WCE2008]|nr:tRNA (N6-threonylcarbamoyladenosine(37)-N6)-methyltransferase TrmO [Bacteroidales bacterium]SKC43281.1 tRNA-Thr(GGU) m(6)t(6)A37 methyltransferase TsaA [Bacteroidales bacterium WCE2008]